MKFCYHIIQYNIFNLIKFLREQCVYISSRIIVQGELLTFEDTEFTCSLLSYSLFYVAFYLTLPRLYVFIKKKTKTDK